MESMEDFLEACRRAALSDKLVLVKFYSKRCAACRRIAARYRRVALRYRQDIDCYDMEQDNAGRELLEARSVTQVPTVQMFHGAGVNRLANLSCQPTQFKEVEEQIKVCIESRRQELSEFAMVGGMMGREFIQETRDKNERMIDVLLGPPPGPA